MSNEYPTPEHPWTKTADFDRAIDGTYLSDDGYPWLKQHGEWRFPGIHADDIGTNLETMGVTLVDRLVPMHLAQSMVDKLTEQVTSLKAALRPLSDAHTIELRNDKTGKLELMFVHNSRNNSVNGISFANLRKAFREFTQTIKDS